jgi:hypothetical protein
MAAYNNDLEADEIVRREAAKRGISETMYRMLRVADTSVVQDIVWDHVGRPSPLTPASMAASPRDRAAPEHGTGWQKERPLRAPDGIEHVDAIADAFSERERRKAILDAAMENEFILRQEQRLRDRELDPCNTGLYKTKDQLDRGE